MDFDSMRKNSLQSTKIDSSKGKRQLILLYGFCFVRSEQHTKCGKYLNLVGHNKKYGGRNAQCITILITI